MYHLRCPQIPKLKMCFNLRHSAGVFLKLSARQYFVLAWNFDITKTQLISMHWHLMIVTCLLYGS